MKYLIIGGTRIFGEPLIDLILTSNPSDKILATYRAGEKYFERDRLSWTELDVRDTNEMDKVVEMADADVIYHFATQDSVGYAWEHPVETVDINVVGTINLLNAVKKLPTAKTTRIVIGGSGEEYGRIAFSDLPMREDVRPNPVNIFGATKACQTMFARLYVQAYDMDIVILRTFNETSEKQDERFSISSFCRQFVAIERGQQKPVIYIGNVHNRRDFTDVYDLSKAFQLVGLKGKKGEIYNAARGKGISLKEIVEILEKLTGIQVELRMDNERVRPIDIPAAIANILKIERDTGWKASIPIEETLKRMLERWRGKL